MTPPTHDKLRERLVAFGQSLTESQCKELRSILDVLAALAYDVGEVYKMAVIDLIPSKVGIITAKSCEQMRQQAAYNINKMFSPAAKQDKGNPLAELLHNLSEADKAKLVSGLKTKLGE
jgi:hypothetical protein